MEIARGQLERHIDDIFGRRADLGMSLAMVVMHRGEIVAERYGIKPANDFEAAEPITADSTLISWSMAKSITHAAVGLLVQDGRIEVDAPAPVPAWSGTDKERITTLDLLEMRSGLRFVEDYVDGETSNVIEMLFGSGADDHATYAAAMPLDHEPGSVWNYSSGTTNIVARIIGDLLGGGRDGMDAFLRDRLFGPAGMSSAIPKFDAAGTFVGSSFVYATARDFARFGELYRHDGVTERGERILPAGWMEHARTRAADDTESKIAGGLGYGRHWWLWSAFSGSLAAHGYEGQFIVVVPDRELTIVHLGKTDAEVNHHLAGQLQDIVRLF